MNDKKLIEALLGIGLSENEARVYLGSLSLGPATVLKIASTAEVKRTTVYPVIDSLKHKGLMRTVPRGLKRLFVAEDPGKLDVLALNMREKLKNTLPAFQALYNLGGNEGSIKYFEGLEGIKSIYRELLKEMQPGDYYCVISEEKEWLRADQQFFEEFRKERGRISQSLGISIRLLLQDSPEAKKVKKYEKNYNEKVKTLPVATNLTTNLIVTPRKTIIHQLIPPISAIVIESKSIIQMHKEMFEIAWKVAA